MNRRSTSLCIAKSVFGYESNCNESASYITQVGRSCIVICNSRYRTASISSGSRTEPIVDSCSSRS